MFQPNIRKIFSVCVYMGVLTCLTGCIGVTTSEDHFTLSISIDAAFQKMNIVPVLIVGSGPAGLTAAMYSARANIPTLVLEGNLPGGLLTQTSEVENWPGIFKQEGKDIIAQNKKQAVHAGAYMVADALESIDISSWPYQVITQGGKQYYALSVIIATGATPRLLGVPGESVYFGRGVTSCAVCDAPFYKDARVVVVGGGDSAVEEAIQLSGYAREITILVRRDVMRASAAMQSRISAYKNISIRYNSAITEIKGDDVQVTNIMVQDTVTKNVEEMPIDGVFLAIGHDPNTSIFKDVVNLDGAGYIKLRGRSQRTSRIMIYAAGDVEDHVYRQAGVAAGSGIKAALEVAADLGSIGYNDTTRQALDLVAMDQQPMFSDEVTSITDKQGFDSLIHENPLSLVYFYEDDCVQCTQMTPVFADIARDFSGQIAAGVVHMEQARTSDLEHVIKEYFIHKVPCLLVFQQGKLVGRYQDVMNRQELTMYVEKFLYPDLHREE